MTAETCYLGHPCEWHHNRLPLNSCGLCNSSGSTKSKEHDSESNHMVPSVSRNACNCIREIHIDCSANYGSQQFAKGVVAVSASESLDIAFEEVLDMSNDHLDLFLCKLWEYRQRQEPWRCLRHNFQVRCLVFQFGVGTQLVDGNGVMDGGSNFVRIEVFHECITPGRFCDITMPHCIYIWADLRKHNVSNACKEFSVALCNTAPVGIAIV